MTGTPEYGVLNQDGDLGEWSCGCPKTFQSMDTLLAWCNPEPGDVIVRREVTATEWAPVRQPSAAQLFNGA